MYFDAEPWFLEASDDEILDLVDINYAYDYQADDVAQYFEDAIPAMGRLFRYVRSREGIGFECVIDSYEAATWIRVNRPHLEDYLDGEVPCGYRPTLGIGNRIIWQPQT